MTKSRGIGRGGYRVGSGGKAKPPVLLDIAPPEIESTDTTSPASNENLSDLLAHKDPKVFLLALMNDGGADVKIRADAAKALMPFMHQKKGESSTKDKKNDAAKVAGKGRFGAVEPPRLVSNNGR